MTEEIEKMLEKSERFLASAKWDFKGEMYDAVINRAYYTVFTCMQTLLCVKEISSKTHSGTHNQFHQYFIARNEFVESEGMNLKVLYDMRQSTDYDFEIYADKDDAESAIEYAEGFLNKTKEWLAKNNS